MLDAQVGPNSPPPRSQSPCAPGPRPPRDAGAQPRATLTFPHHRLQPRGRHLPQEAPPPLPGLSQGRGVAPRVIHVDPAPLNLAPPAAHLARSSGRFSER